MIPELNRHGQMPLYQQIEEWIREQIGRGVWPEHYKIMAEIDLASVLGVSRGTVRRALTKFLDNGMLVRIHGRGTFVASSTLEQPLAERLIAFSEDLINKGIPFETQVLKQVVTQPSKRIASLLSISEGGKVFALHRIRSVRQAPLILLKNYVNYEYCPGIENVDFTQFRLFQTLEDRYDLELDWGTRTFEAQGADKETAYFLEIPEWDPGMYLEQVVYLRDGSPIELSDLWLRGDRFRLSATVKRDGIRGLSQSSSEYI